MVNLKIQRGRPQLKTDDDPSGDEMKFQKIIN